MVYLRTSLEAEADGYKARRSRGNAGDARRFIETSDLPAGCSGRLGDKVNYQFLIDALNVGGAIAAGVLLGNRQGCDVSGVVGPAKFGKKTTAVRKLNGEKGIVFCVKISAIDVDDSDASSDAAPASAAAKPAAPKRAAGSTKPSSKIAKREERRVGNEKLRCVSAFLFKLNGHTQWLQHTGNWHFTPNIVSNLATELLEDRVADENGVYARSDLAAGLEPCFDFSSVPSLSDDWKVHMLDLTIGGHEFDFFASEGFHFGPVSGSASGPGAQRGGGGGFGGGGYYGDNHGGRGLGGGDGFGGGGFGGGRMYGGGYGGGYDGDCGGGHGGG